MGEAELIDQPRQRACLLQGVQVLALNVLDQRHRDRSLIRHVADHGGDCAQAGNLGRPPAALARDDLITLRFARIPLRQGAHQNGLHHALGFDRIGEFAERFQAHVDARLVLASLQQIERQSRQAVARSGRGLPGRGRGALCEQRAQLGKASTE